MTFIDYIDDMPGLHQYARNMHRLIDERAARTGRQIAESYTPASLRASVYEDDLSPSLISQKRAMADALERDPSGRLASVPSLRAWAMKPDGIGSTWINYYVGYFIAYLDSQKAPSLVPLMVAAE